MRPFASTAVIALIALAPVACSDGDQPTEPVAPASGAALSSGVAHAHGGKSERLVNVMDACDPETFNAVLGPGTCIRNGGVKFDTFIKQLSKQGKAGAWHFAPPTMNVKVGEVLLALNRGGEVHTFTEVEEFGGGFVDELNTLLDLQTVEECELANLGSSDFIPPGGTQRDEVEEEGTELYQCCIHPWMRTTVHAREH
jgi:plastocyanin